MLLCIVVQKKKIVNTIQDTNEVFYNPIVKLDKCIKIILQSSMARGKKKLTKTINYSNINKLMNHSIEAKYKNKMNQNIQIQDLTAYKKKRKKKDHLTMMFGVEN
jgi:hypothetical protein